IFALESDCLDNFCQQLSSSSHKRPRLGIFIGAGRLPHKHQACVPIAVGIDDVGSTLMQRAARAVADVCPNRLKTFRRLFELWWRNGEVSKQRGGGLGTSYLVKWCLRRGER